MKSPLAATMIGSITYSRPKMDLQARFANADPLALDLVEKMLKFDPRDRPTAEECLAHPYLAPFHREKKEPRCSHKVTMALSDAKRYSIREYRNQVYKEAVTAPEKIAKPKPPR